MILTCSACRTRYRVSEEAVSRPSGRTVRCANCGNTWLHVPAVVPPPLRERAPPMEPPLRERVPPAEPQPLALEPRPAITAPMPPRRHRSGLGWVVLILLFGGAIVAAILGRDKVVAYWPQAAQFYEMVGLRTEPVGAGLDIANVTSTRNADGLIVEGDIIDRVAAPRNVPRLRVTLRDASQKELAFKIVEPPRERLLPGETSHFTVAFLPAPDTAVGVVVTFSAS